MADSHFDKLSQDGEALVIRYINGESQVEKDIYQVVGDIVIRYLKAAVNQSRKSATGVFDKEPEDLLHLTFLSVRKQLKAKRYRPEGKFRHWVLTIAVRKFLSSLGKKIGAPAHEEKDGPGDGIKESADPPPGNPPTMKTAERPPATFINPEEMPDDTNALLLERELLNLMLEGLRTLGNDTAAGVWTARVFLGKSELEVCEMFELPSNTCKSHFHRACEHILSHVHSKPGYEDVPIKGLRHICLQRLTLEERDLALITDPLQRKALTFAASGPMAWRDLAAHLDTDGETARSVLLAAIAILAKAKIKRIMKGPAALTPEALAAWLWDEVGQALAAYPDAPAATRAAPPSQDAEELAALCQLGVYLGFIGSSGEPESSLGELLQSRIDAGEIEEASRRLELDPDSLLMLLADALPKERMSSRLLALIRDSFDLSEPRIQAALRAGASSRGRAGTRGMSKEDETRFLERAARRVLGA